MAQGELVPAPLPLISVLQSRLESRRRVLSQLERAGGYFRPVSADYTVTGASFLANYSTDEQYIYLQVLLRVSIALGWPTALVYAGRCAASISGIPRVAVAGELRFTVSQFDV